MLDKRFYTSQGPIPIATLIEGLEAKLPDPKFSEELISAASELAGSAPGSVTFLTSKKGLPALETAKATACFVTQDLAGEVGARHIIPIVSKTPRAHFARVMSRLISVNTAQNQLGSGSIAANAVVHPSAVIGPGAEIGERVYISPNVVVGPSVRVGAGSHIGANVCIEFSILGENCVIKPGAVIGGRGFGVASDETGIIDIAHFGRVIIGDNVSIGSNSCIDRGQLGDTVIGDNVKIDNLVQVGHNVKLGHNCMIAGQTGISGSCTIGNNVVMGGAAGLADHLVIGDDVQIAARSGVMHNIPAGEVWGGIPAQPIREFMRMVAASRKLAEKSGSRKS